MFDLKTIGLSITTVDMYKLTNVETGEVVYGDIELCGRLTNAKTHKARKEDMRRCGRIQYPKLKIDWYIPLLSNVQS